MFLLCRPDHALAPYSSVDSSSRTNMEIKWRRTIQIQLKFRMLTHHYARSVHKVLKYWSPLIPEVHLFCRCLFQVLPCQWEKQTQWELRWWWRWRWSFQPSPTWRWNQSASIRNHTWLILGLLAPYPKFLFFFLETFSLSDRDGWFFGSANDERFPTI